LVVFALSFHSLTAATFRGDRILIKPKAGTDSRTLASFHRAQQAEVARTLGRLQVVRVRRDVQSAIMAYRGSGLVEFAEPDYWVHLARTEPNDPAFADGTLWGLDRIDASEGWDLATSANNIVVAVIDTGVRYTHEDLAANMWIHPTDGSHGLDVLTGSNDPNDDSGHGTLIAGIIGATANNVKGVAGVAWQVKIMACKFADNNGGTISDAIACIDYARTNGARIINASWGTYEDSLSLSNAIYEAREAGILVVGAAGNSARNIDDPDWHYRPASLAMDNIVSVAATTRGDELYRFSNIGATNVDLAAPGDDVYSTYSLANDAYARDEGTSMAAAYVSGACALLRARFPDESAGEIIDRLLAGVDPLPALSGKCVSGGRLNLYKAFGPNLTAISTNAGPFRMRLTGKAQQSYVIEASTNLVNWSAVHTNTTALDGTFVFNAEMVDWRPEFFRAVSAP
jgi:subtilisin family serine protease